MDTMQWTGRLTTDNFEIDLQHRIFAGIIGKIAASRNNGGEKRLTESLLTELLKFTEFHFCSEENIMLEHGYPSLSEHKREHDRMLVELRKRLFNLKYEYVNFNSLETFITEWFTEHATTADTKLALYIKNNPVES